MIKFYDIIKNKEYRERVIKYFRLPMRLSVSEEKFISDLEYMKLIDKDFVDNVINLTEADFNKEVERQGTNEPDFTMEYIFEPIVENFANTDKWKKIQEKDYSDVLNGYNGITNTHNFYIKENDNKCLLSIDLVSANWQSLQHILGFDESYEDLIVKYTDNLIPPISKTFRTKITGLLNAKKIMDYNKFLLFQNKDIILSIITEKLNLDFEANTPFAFYADEFIMELTGTQLEKLYKIDYDEIENAIYEETGIKVHFVPFKLKWLDLEKSCVKVYKDDYEILNLSKDILLLVNKKINGIENKEIDFEKVKKTDDLIKKIDNVSLIIKNLQGGFNFV